MSIVTRLFFTLELTVSFYVYHPHSNSRQRYGLCHAQFTDENVKVDDL